MSTSTYTTSAFELANFKSVSSTPQQNLAIEIIEAYEDISTPEWADIMNNSLIIAAVAHIDDSYIVVELGKVTLHENHLTVKASDNELTSAMLEDFYNIDKVYVVGSFDGTPEANEYHQLECAALASFGIDTDEDFVIILDKDFQKQVSEAIVAEEILMTAEKIAVHTDQTGEKVAFFARRGHGMPDSWWLELHEIADNGNLYGVFQKGDKLEYVTVSSESEQIEDLESITLSEFTTTSFNSLDAFEEKAIIGSCQSFDGETYYKVTVSDEPVTLSRNQLGELFLIEN